MIAFAKPPGTAGVRTAEELLAEFRSTGAPAPFEELVRRYAAMVFSECYAVTKSRQDAEDASQATFLTLAVQARTGDEIRHLGPWLQRVARRVALDQEKAKRRRRKREDNHHRVNGSSGLATPDRLTLDQLELRHVINEELNELPARYRMPLVLHYFGGMTREQMSRELKCKPATLGVRLFRARDMLGKRLAKRGVMLPAVAIPFAIAAVVRESVESHGILSMAASASQIARAASHVALGMPLPSHVASPVSMALADHAARDLVLRKVKAIIAAAAIGASALAAGSAEVVRQIHNGTLSLPALFDTGGYFRFLKSPQLPQMHVDATQVIDGPQFALGGTSPSSFSGLRTSGLSLDGPGHLELDAVSVGGAPTYTDLARTVGSTGGISGAPRSAAPLRAEALPSRSDPEIGGPQVASAARSDTHPETDVAVPSGSASSSDASTDDAQNPLLGAMSLGGGGGGGLLPSANLFSLSPVPPLSSASSGLKTFPFHPGTGLGSSALSPTNYATQGGVLRGYGHVVLPGTFEMNGVVIADGYGTARTLDFSSVASILHDIPNAPTGINGWYAQHAGKLTLPAISIASGTNTFTWGDARDKTTLDLVNTARLTLHDVAASGSVTLSLLASDRADVPRVPATYDVLTIWSLASTTPYSSLDFTARYALVGADLAAPTSGLNLYYYDGRHWQSATSEIDVSRRTISADGLPASAFVALFTSHGKATDPLASAGISDDAGAAGPMLAALPADAAPTVDDATTGVTYAATRLSDVLDSDTARAAYAMTLCPTLAELATTSTADPSTADLTASATLVDGAAAVTSNDADVSTPSFSARPALVPGSSVVPEPATTAWAFLALPILARRPRRQ